MLRRIVCRGRQLSPESISTDLQTSCGLQISSRTVSRELHGMGFHGRAAASKLYITNCNAKRRMQWCKARRHWTLEQWRHVLWSDDSHFSIWQSWPGISTIATSGLCNRISLTRELSDEGQQHRGPRLQQREERLQSYAPPPLWTVWQHFCVALSSLQDPSQSVHSCTPVHTLHLRLHPLPGQHLHHQVWWRHYCHWTDYCWRRESLQGGGGSAGLLVPGK